jgi:2'-5' RNA ligase
MSVIAINVLLIPDAYTIEKARAVNARLRDDYPEGFALDADHAPHITVLQRFVRTEHLDDVAHAVTDVLREQHFMQWESRATGYYHLASGNLGLVGIVIEPTSELVQLQQATIDATDRFSVEQGMPDAFAPRPDGRTISQSTVDYVNQFVGSRTGADYHPHLTVGIATRDFIDALMAEPFEAFTVRAVSVCLYQAGDYGVAQRKLHDLLSLRG